jgi:UDP-N-acetylmuramate--alanine ligase
LTQLPAFEGIDRRMMVKGRSRGATVLDDYAHHPTEIRATLSAIQERFEPRRLWCVFQPHQYSRTRFLLDDFAESFKLAHVTIVPEIYFVRDSEETKQAVNAQVLVGRLAGQGSKAVFIKGFTDICEYLVDRVEPGDVVVTMGAGDIWKVANEYIQRFGRDC